MQLLSACQVAPPALKVSVNFSGHGYEANHVVAQAKKSEKRNASTKERVIEEYFCKRIKKLGGLTWKNNPAWAIGIPDRTFAVRGYMGVVEFKRPRGGRFSQSQIYWDKMLTNAGCMCHHINTTEAVDLFLIEVENGTYRARIRNDIVRI